MSRTEESGHEGKRRGTYGDDQKEEQSGLEWDRGGQETFGPDQSKASLPRVVNSLIPCGSTLIVHLTSSLRVGSVINLKQQLALLHFNLELRFSNLIQPSKLYWVILQVEPTDSVVRIFPGRACSGLGSQ